MTKRAIGTRKFPRLRAKQLARPMRVAAACLAAAGLVGLAGCGGSSKPAYCSDRSNLESSIKGLTSLNRSSGISGLKTQVQTIQSDATKLVSSAKSDFPSQTSAIKSSVAALESAVKALPSQPSATQLPPLPPLPPAWSARSRASRMPLVPTAADRSRPKTGRRADPHLPAALRVHSGTLAHASAVTYGRVV